METINRREKGENSPLSAAEVKNNLSENEITELVIGCAIKIHKALGPGLLESAYEECLYYELSKTPLG